MQRLTTAAAATTITHAAYAHATRLAVPDYTSVFSAVAFTAAAYVI